MLSAPAGFAIERHGSSTLLAASGALQTLKAQGLDDPAAWRALLENREGIAGRGATARATLRSGERLILKQLLRGGLIGSLWRERFPGRRRLLENLKNPLVAAARGIATPAPVALLLDEGPPCLFRGWIAFEEVSGARDLIDRWSTGPPPQRAELEVVMQLVRKMHDAGIEHRDLNLGNILLGAAPAGSAEALVIDLDRARVHDGSLRFGLRQRGLRRIERSYLKWFGRSGSVAGDAPPPWYELYAGGDAELLRRFSKGRRAGKALLCLHRRR